MFLPKILVVDDDRLICWALQKEFTSHNITTRVVETAADALAELRKRFLRSRLSRHPSSRRKRDRAPGGDRADLTERENRRHEQRRQRGEPGTCVRRRGAAIPRKAVRPLRNPPHSENARLGKHVHNRKHPRHICRIPLRISIVEPSLEGSPVRPQQPERHRWSTSVSEGCGFTRNTRCGLDSASVRGPTRINDRFRRFVPAESPARGRVGRSGAGWNRGRIEIRELTYSSPNFFTWYRRES